MSRNGIGAAGAVGAVNEVSASSSSSAHPSTNGVSAVGAVSAINAVGTISAPRFSSQPSTPEFDFSVQALEDEARQANARQAEARNRALDTPFSAAASASVTPATATNRASSSSALTGVTSRGFAITPPLRRGLGPMRLPAPSAPLNLSASSSNPSTTHLFSARRPLRNSESGQTSPRQNKNKNSKKNRSGGARRTYRTKRKQRKQRKGTQRKHKQSRR